MEREDNKKLKIRDIVKYKYNYYMIVDKTKDGNCVVLKFSESNSNMKVDYTDYLIVPNNQLEYVCNLFRDFSSDVVNRYNEYKTREPKLFKKDEKVVIPGCLVKYGSNLLFVYDINGNYAKAFGVSKNLENGNKEVITINNEKYVPNFNKDEEFNYKGCKYRIISIASLEELNNIKNLRIDHKMTSQVDTLKRKYVDVQPTTLNNSNIFINTYSDKIQMGTIVCLKNDIDQKYIINSIRDKKVQVISVNALLDNDILLEYELPSKLFIVDKYSSIEDLEKIKEIFEDHNAKKRKKIIERYHK